MSMYIHIWEFFVDINMYMCIFSFVNVKMCNSICQSRQQHQDSLDLPQELLHSAASTCKRERRVWPTRLRCWDCACRCRCWLSGFSDLTSGRTGKSTSQVSVDRWNCWVCARTTMGLPSMMVSRQGKLHFSKPHSRCRYHLIFAGEQSWRTGNMNWRVLVLRDVPMAGSWKWYSKRASMRTGQWEHSKPRPNQEIDGIDRAPKKSLRPFLWWDGFAWWVRIGLEMSSSQSDESIIGGRWLAIVEKMPNHKMSSLKMLQCVKP